MPCSSSPCVPTANGAGRNRSRSAAVSTNASPCEATASQPEWR